MKINKPTKITITIVTITLINATIVYVQSQNNVIKGGTVQGPTITDEGPAGV